MEMLFIHVHSDKVNIWWMRKGNWLLNYELWWIVTNSHIDSVKNSNQDHYFVNKVKNPQPHNQKKTQASLREMEHNFVMNMASL